MELDDDVVTQDSASPIRTSTRRRRRIVVSGIILIYISDYKTKQKNKKQNKNVKGKRHQTTTTS